MSNKTILNEALKSNHGLSGLNTLEFEAKNAAKARTDATESRIGGIANEVVGGVESLSSTFDRFQQTVKANPINGLLNSNSNSIQNLTTSMVDNSITDITTQLSSYTKVDFEDVSIGGISFRMPSSSSLASVGGGSTTIAGVLQKITGLDVGSGDLQKQVLEASPEGLLRAGVRVSGKIGAFTAESINNLANEALSSVTDVLDATGAVTDINRRLSFPSSVDANGDVDAYTQVSDTRPTNLSEFDETIANATTKPLQSLSNIVTTDNETKQDLVTGEKDFSDISGGKDGAQVIAAAQEQQNLRNQYQALADERNSLVQSRVASDGSNGIIQELSTKTITEIRKDVKNFAPKLKNNDVTRVINLSQGNAQEFQIAVDVLFQSTGKPADEIRAFLKTIDTTITNATLPELDNAVFEEPYVIGSFEKEWDGGQGEPVFPYISSVEELQAELRNIKREITEVVVHWSETPTNKNIGSEEINETHLANDLKGIGYHYVIRRDGSLQRGRPANIVGEHAVANGHDERSLAIVFVGGINVPSETRNIEDFTSVQSLTRSQFNTFDHFCRSFYNVFEGGQVVGHSDIDGLANDPGFDVRAYVKANFNKDSKFTTPLTQRPFTTAEINL